MIELTPEQKRRQRQKNITIALGLLALVVLFYIITMVKLTGNIS